MIAIVQKKRSLVFRLALGLVSGLILAWPVSGAAQQPDRGDRGRGPGRPAIAQPDRPDRGAGRGQPARVQPDHRRPPDHRFHDVRYHHNRYYPARGHVIRILPPDHRIVVHGSHRYYFSGGVWYRPYGPRFTVVVPPVGLVVPFLPPYYTTVWVGGVPYYYANEVYYAHRGDGYVVVESPKEEPSQAPPPADQMFIYPRLGQSEQQQADDRYACHRWAVDQTGFDPTQLAGAVSDGQSADKRADYQRAMSACLDGRGYTVK